MAQPDGKGLLGRLRPRWEDNIKTDLPKVGWEGMDWIDLAEGRCRWRAIGGDETSGTVRCGEFLRFALQSCLSKAVRVIMARHFHLLCKCFIFDTEFHRKLSAVCNFIMVYLPLCLVFIYPMF